MEVGSVGIDVDGGGTGWWCVVAAVSLSIGDITVTLPAVPPQLSPLAVTAAASARSSTSTPLHYTD